MTNEPSYVTDGINVYEVVRYWMVKNFGLGADWSEGLLKDIRTEQEKGMAVRTHAAREGMLR